METEPLQQEITYMRPVNSKGHSWESNEASQYSQFFLSHAWGFQGQVPVRCTSDWLVENKKRPVCDFPGSHQLFFSMFHEWKEQVFSMKGCQTETNLFQGSRRSGTLWWLENLQLLVR